MLNLLLDEHISPDVADGLRARTKRLVVYALAEWENGPFLGQEDALCLREAARKRLTLVTYDRRTIPPLLKAWAEEGQNHGGVIFVDDKTLSPANIGGLIRALSRLSKQAGHWDWQNRIYFLQVK